MNFKEIFLFLFYFYVTNQYVDNNKNNITIKNIVIFIEK